MLEYEHSKFNYICRRLKFYVHMLFVYVRINSHTILVFNTKT